MEKRKWLWKKRSSEKSPGETESSGSLSSHSERYSDEQDSMKGSPNYTQSPEVTSKIAISEDEDKESVKNLRAKLSAALVNLSAKEDLVKQHAKVAEEAIAGWEKAENDAATLKKQLEAAVQQNLHLEVRATHLDGALKECVRQLRQAKDEQEQRIHDSVADKAREWESTKLELENKLIELQNQLESGKIEHPDVIDPGILIKLETLKKENSALRYDLLSKSEELEIMMLERDFSTQAAETASKQQLESIKKVARLEAECRRLRAMINRKSSSFTAQKSFSYVESLTDSHSDSAERLSVSEAEISKVSKSEMNECDASCSGSWASALIAELDQFKNGKAKPQSFAKCSVEIDMMDDFLEMEQLAALPETKQDRNSKCSDENPLRAELDLMITRVSQLEEKLKKAEAERDELENALNKSQDALNSSRIQLKETEIKLKELRKELNSANKLNEMQLEKLQKELNSANESNKIQLEELRKELNESNEFQLDELQKELNSANESKELLEFQLISMEADARTMTSNVQSLKAEVEKERSFSAEMTGKFHELEKEVRRKAEEAEMQKAQNSSNEPKIKQEDLAVAADKLAECQKTIASLGRQLKSLATLEDFLIDAGDLPGFPDGRGSVTAAVNDVFTLRTDLVDSGKPNETSDASMNGNKESPGSSSSSSSGHTKNRNGIGKLFSRSKSGNQHL